MNYDYVINNEEKAILNLRNLYRCFGYSNYKMSKFEEYDMYVRNKDFLVSDSIITFTNTDGRLMALKPDVTLSIIKNFDYVQGNVQKVYYDEKVYRTCGNHDGFREITQVGLECMGSIDDYNECEVVSLALLSLKQISEDYILDISHMGIIGGLIDELNINKEFKDKIIECISEKNSDELLTICQQKDVDKAMTEKLLTLIKVHGNMNYVLNSIEQICINKRMHDAIKELKLIYSSFKGTEYENNIRIDFSVVNDMNYYSGIVFQGFVNGIATGILSGGRYDNMMYRVSKKCGAIGFAVYLDKIERLYSSHQIYDSECVLLYSEKDNIKDILNGVKIIAASGMSVRALADIPENYKYKTVMKLSGTEVIPFESND